MQGLLVVQPLADQLCLAAGGQGCRQEGDRWGQVAMDGKLEVDVLHVVVDDIVGQDAAGPQEDEGLFGRVGPARCGDTGLRRE